MKINQEDRNRSRHHHLLEDEKRLLQSQVQLERRKLEAEQVRQMFIQNFTTRWQTLKSQLNFLFF